MRSRPRSNDAWSRHVLYLGLGLLLLWLTWGLVYETTGAPGVNYLSFGLVSLPVGSILSFASLIGYARAHRKNFATWDAVAALVTSVALAVLPFLALLELTEDYS